MNILKSTKKITTSTLKAFAKRNKDRLYIKEESSFDGMVDCVMPTKSEWKQTEISENTDYYKTGITGVYTVGNSRDYFSLYDTDQFIGIEVYNCCGSSILAVKKIN